MKRTLIVVMFLAVSRSLMAGQVPSTEPIKISADKYRWLMISSEPPMEVKLPNGQTTKVPGMAMLRDQVDLSYDKGDYRPDRVNLVAEVQAQDEKGNTISHKASLVREIKTPTGTIWCVWATSGKSFKGRGTMRVWLTEPRKNGKILSNILAIPVAADAAAQQALRAELGSWIKTP